MKIGIGLPFKTPTESWPRIREIAMRTEAGPFTAFGVIDRLAYDNYEPLSVLSAVAAVTERLRLYTAILVAPVRNAGVIAKQAATIDAISGGRFTLGLAVGSREDDAIVAPSGFHDRGQRFDGQLQHMRRIWAGETLEGAERPVGPAPAQQGGPEVLIGGTAPRAIARVGRFGDGYVMGGRAMDAEWVKDILARVNESWQAHERPGRPRIVASLPFALGPAAEEAVSNAIADYYGGRPVARAGRQLRPNLTSAEAIREVIALHEELGTDEFIFRPATLDRQQVERLEGIIA